MNIEVASDEHWTAVNDEQHQDGSEFIVEIDGDWPRSVDGKYDDVRA